MARIPGRNRKPNVIAPPMSPAATSVARDAEHAGDRSDERVRQRHQPDRDEPVEARDASEQPARDEALLRRRPHDQPRALQRVEDEARGHQLPRQPRQPVASDHERRDGPRDVHERHEPPGERAVRHHDRGEHRADAAEREHEAEDARAAPISTLTTYGTSTSAGPQKIRYASVAARNVPHSHTRVRT